MFDLYLFGSVLHTKNYQDIDILIVYELDSHAQIIKKVIEEQLPHSLLHFMCLTVAEERELDFIRTTAPFKILAGSGKGDIPLRGYSTS